MESTDELARRLKLAEYNEKPTNQSLTEGVKDDSDKTPVHLVAPEFIFATAEILKFGAKKYEEHNWAKGMRWSRVFSALMRHLWAWWGGKGRTCENFLFGECDSETGRSHLWHAACCIMFLVCYEEWEMNEFDDRYNPKGD